MIIRRFARPYARAIMHVAASPENAAAIRDDLRRFEEVRRASTDLQEVFANPGIEIDAKIGIARRLAERLHLSDVATRVLEVLIRNHRINDLDPVVAAVAAYVNDALGVAVAEVKSAKALTPEELAQLAETLARKAGRRVEVQIMTDPSLIGGFVAQIGSEIYDASVAGKIDRFRESLT